MKIAMMAACTCASLQVWAAHVVQTGTMAEGRYGVATAETMTRDGCGNVVNMFFGKWTPESVRAVGEHCRRNGCVFTMDEMLDRISGDWKPDYSSSWREILAILREYGDVCAGTQHYSETGGVMFYWHPGDVLSRARPAVRIPDGGDSFAMAHEATCVQVRRDYLQAKEAGLPEPIFSIECSFGFAPYLLRAGYGRVDLEVIYTDELERAFAGVKTASEAFGRKTFGADMAMAWYGGALNDGLWKARWRTSLYHAYLRGADPIYNEHGFMGIETHGRSFGAEHPETCNYRKTLADFTTWCRANPRADGYPLAAVAVVQGRLDGYAGVFQTHLFGQRTNEAFRVSDADCAWRIFDGLYRRRAWQDGEANGEADFSGNPPLGMAGILPYDAPASEFAKYRFLFLLGRNVMDASLYSKLVDYVRNGGILMLAASHLTAQEKAGGGFIPFNGGDWSELAGVRTVPGKPWRVPHGVKFIANPSTEWSLHPLNGLCDPGFTDGGFEVPPTKMSGATPIAVASDGFADLPSDAAKSVLFANRVGNGLVVFLSSLDSPGAPGVRRLYSLLLAKAVEAVGRKVWPKVECSDTVRWSVYQDGTVYLLNTEPHLAQEAIVERAEGSARVKVSLAPGEIKALRQHQ